MSNVGQYLPGLRPISGAINKLTAPIYAKYGLVKSRIITDWDIIAGKTIATQSKPLNLYFKGEAKNNGLLVVEVYNSSLAMQMLYMEPIIIEKISTYFGYKVVSKIKIQQKPMSRNSLANKPAAIKEKRPINQDILLMINNIEDPELKKSLQNLLEAI